MFYANNNQIPILKSRVKENMSDITEKSVIKRKLRLEPKSQDVCHFELLKTNLLPIFKHKMRSKLEIHQKHTRSPFCSKNETPEYHFKL